MDRLMHWLHWKISRVDTQVSLFMTIIVLISSLQVYGISYIVTYDNMIDSLRERVLSIHRYLECELAADTFYTINTRADMQKKDYTQVKQKMEQLRQVTGVMYLYTAKVTPEGDFIYVIDGLSEDEDFRYPGDKIESEIYPDMRLAMSGSIVWPNDIKETNWGKIFITYFPFHDEHGKIIGVLGIEIAADSQYDAYRMLRILTPISILVFCFISVAFAINFFRRISNPTYQDMLNTDQLTNLKNRNSFEIDFANLLSRGAIPNAGMLVMDLDNLKQVNDILGHEAGDLYIREAAQSLQTAIDKRYAAYRTGGDEFAVIFPNTNDDELAAFTESIRNTFTDLRTDNTVPTSLSIGTALFHADQDDDIRAIYRRADAKMYEWKKQHRSPYKRIN